MINRADKAALVPVQKIHSLAGIYTGVNKGWIEYRALNKLLDYWAILSGRAIIRNF